jgi:hypothetical protein
MRTLKRFLKSYRSKEGSFRNGLDYSLASIHTHTHQWFAAFSMQQYTFYKEKREKKCWGGVNSNIRGRVKNTK